MMSVREVVKWHYRSHSGSTEKGWKGLAKKKKFFGWSNQRQCVQRASCAKSYEANKPIDGSQSKTTMEF